MSAEIVIGEGAERVIEGFAGGLLGGALASFVILAAFLIVAGLYVYSSLALFSIFKRLRYKRSWIAWIPLARCAVILLLGGFSWKYIFLLLIPILGWFAVGVLLIISFWNIFEKLKYPGALSLIVLGFFIPALSGIAQIAFLVVLGVVAWKK